MDQDYPDQDDNVEERFLQRRELMQLHRTTRVSQAYDRVPKPKEALPTNPLPLWHLMSLNCKVPSVPAPDGTFVITRSEIAETLFIKTKNSCFDTVDPYIQETPIEYDPLHDPHLKEYFQHNPGVIQQLVDFGLVTRKGNVKCTLAELNRYRQYVSRVYNCHVNAERASEENWRASQIKQVKDVRNCTYKIARDKRAEEMRKRRVKAKQDYDARTMLVRRKRLEHPSNFIVEIRARELAIRKRRREQKRLHVALRLAAIRKAEQKRRSMILLHIICQEEFSQKLRNYLCEEKRVNREADLASFIRDKRKYQEEKLRYHRALLARDDLEKACQIVERQAKYDLKDLHMRQAARNKLENAEMKRRHIWYIMRKYFRKWYLYCFRVRPDVTHSSCWHVRRLLRQTGLELKVSSGTRSFTSFLKDILMGRNGPKEAFSDIAFDVQTQDEIQELLDVLVECSYLEFVRRATSCLVDHVVEEARKKCVTYVCQKGFDPYDLVEPVIPKRLLNQIRLEKPTWPCTGPCAQFAKGEEWRKKCKKMHRALGKLHDQLSKKVTKKLSGDLQRLLDDDGSLGTMEKKVMAARGSREMKAAADTVAGIAIDRASADPADERMQREFVDDASDQINKSYENSDYDRTRRYEKDNLQSQLDRAKAKQKELRRGLGEDVSDGETGAGTGGSRKSGDAGGRGGTGATAPEDEDELERISAAIIRQVFEDEDEVGRIVSEAIASQKELLEHESEHILPPAAAVIEDAGPSLAVAAAAQPMDKAEPPASEAKAVSGSPAADSGKAKLASAQPGVSGADGGKGAEALATGAEVTAAGPGAADSGKGAAADESAKGPKVADQVPAAAQPTGKVEPPISEAKTASGPPVVDSGKAELASAQQGASGTDGGKGAEAFGTSAEVNASGPGAAESGKGAAADDSAEVAATGPGAAESGKGAAADDSAEVTAVGPGAAESGKGAAADDRAKGPEVPDQVSASAQPMGKVEPPISKAETVSGPELGKEELASAQQGASEADGGEGAEALSTSADVPAAGPGAAESGKGATPDKSAQGPEVADQVPPAAQAIGKDEPPISEAKAVSGPSAADSGKAELASAQQGASGTDGGKGAEALATSAEVTAAVPGAAESGEGASADDVAKGPEVADQVPAAGQPMGKAETVSGAPATDAEQAELASAQEGASEADAGKGAEVLAPSAEVPAAGPGAAESGKGASADESTKGPEVADQVPAADQPMGKDEPPISEAGTVSGPPATDSGQEEVAAAQQGASGTDRDKGVEALPTGAEVPAAGPGAAESGKGATADESAKGSEVADQVPAAAQAIGKDEPPISEAKAVSGPSVADSGSAQQGASGTDGGEGAEALATSAEVPGAGSGAAESSKGAAADDSAEVAGGGSGAAESGEGAAADGRTKGSEVADQVPASAQIMGEAEPLSSEAKTVSGPPAADSGKEGPAAAQQGASGTDEGERAEALATSTDGPAAGPGVDDSGKGPEVGDQVPAAVAISKPDESKPAPEELTAAQQAEGPGTSGPLGPDPRQTEGEKRSPASPAWEDISATASKMVTTAICGACGKETALLNEPIDGRPMTSDANMGVGSVPSGSGRVSSAESDRLAGELADRAIQNVVDGKHPCPDDAKKEAQYGSPGDARKSVDDLSRVASHLTNSAVQSAAGRGQGSSDADNISRTASEMIVTAICAGCARIRAEKEGGVKVLVQPKVMRDDSGPGTAQGSQLGMTISMAPSEVESGVLLTVDESGKIDRLASKMAGQALDKSCKPCAADEALKGKADASRSYAGLYEEDDLSHLASQIATTAVEAAHGKETAASKAKGTPDKAMAQPADAKETAAYDHDDLSHVASKLALTAVDAAHEKEKAASQAKAPVLQKIPETNAFIPSASSTASGVEMILYPQVLPSASNARLDPTASMMDKMTYNVEESDASLLDLQYHRLSGARGKSLIHEGMSTFPSAAVLQDQPPLLGQGQAGQGQVPPALPTAQRVELPRRPGGPNTLPPDARANVREQLRAIRNALTDVTETLREEGVLLPQPPPPPNPPGNP